jgi:multidrug efflux system outer membrane protein
VAQVAAEYLTWVSDREALEVSEQTADAQRKSYELTKLNEANGNGTELSVAQAETTLRTAEASVAQYRRQMAQDLDELVLLVGASLPQSLQDEMAKASTLDAEPAFPALPAGLPSDLLERRPDIRAAEHALLAANANIGAARAAFFPQLTLTADGGTSSSALQRLFSPGQSSWSFNPQITVPIFDAGKNFAALDYAHIEARIEIANYGKSIQSAFHDVSDALAARTTYHDQLDAEALLVDADRRYFSLSNMRFEAGVDSYLDVLVAENALFEAELTLISLRLTEKQNLITLYKALGGGWSEQTATAPQPAE